MFSIDDVSKVACLVEIKTTQAHWMYVVHLVTVVLSDDLVLDEP
jgi:hypothetical protein